MTVENCNAIIISFKLKLEALLLATIFANLRYLFNLRQKQTCTHELSGRFNKNIIATKKIHIIGFNIKSTKRA